MRVVIPLGYDTTWVLPKLVSLHPAPDSLVVLTVPGEGRAKIALESLRLTVEGLTARGLPLKLEIMRVDPGDYPSLLARCMDAVRPDGEEVAVLLGGGMRVLNVALMQASLATPGTRVEVLLEGQNRWIEVTADGATRCCLRWLGGTRGEILKRLGRSDPRPLPMDELSKLLGKSKSTLSGHLRELEEVGLLERTSRKPVVVRLTPAGRSMARILSRRRGIP